MARGPLWADNDHGVSIISTLVLYWLQHDHALCVFFTQSVQRNHCFKNATVSRKQTDGLINQRNICLTRDSVQLHTGVGVRQTLRLVKRLEDRERPRRRDVGNLQGQCGL